MSKELMIAIATILYTIITIINNVKGKKSLLAATSEVMDTFTNKDNTDIKRFERLELKITYVISEYRQDLLQRLEITNDEKEKQLILDKLETLSKLEG